VAAAVAAGLEIELEGDGERQLRPLSAVGLLLHAQGHAPHQRHDFLAFRLHVAHEGGGERAVAPTSVGSRVAGLGGVDDDIAATARRGGAGSRRLPAVRDSLARPTLRAPRDATCRRRTLQHIHQRIVAARIEDP
jgi:hypothetical protein